MAMENVIDDPELSWKAKGIYAATVAKLKSGEFSRDNLELMSKDGKSATSRGVKELMQHGYLIREIVRENGRFIGTKWSTNDSK